jgi:hypothetical protein
LGREASVVFDPHDHSPTTLQFGACGKGLRSLDEEFEDDPERGASLVDEIPIVSVWSLHVALYALQNPTPDNILQALSMIGTSGDCEEHADMETLRPLPVPEPPGWDDPLWVAPAASEAD